MTDDDLNPDDSGILGVPFRYNDGGRRAAGHSGDAPGDCAVRAIAIAFDLPYTDVYNELWRHMKRREAESRTRNRKHYFSGSPRSGVPKECIDDLMIEWGWEWRPLVTIGQKEKMHLRYDELPEAALTGSAIMNCSKHVVAVVRGVLHDTHDPCREGTRLVYGYWSSGDTLAVLRNLA